MPDVLSLWLYWGGGGGGLKDLSHHWTLHFRLLRAFDQADEENEEAGDEDEHLQQRDLHKSFPRKMSNAGLMEGPISFRFKEWKTLPQIE